jgi:hypothetical protein
MLNKLLLQSRIENFKVVFKKIKKKLIGILYGSLLVASVVFITGHQVH